MKAQAKFFTCLGLSLVALMLAGEARAQGFKWWQNEQFRKELALSADQIQKLEGVFEATRPTLRQQKDELDRLEGKLEKLVADARADETRVADLVDKVEAARGVLSKTRTLMVYKMRRLLTNEQHLKMKAMHEQMERDRRRRGGRDHGDHPHQ